MLELMILPLLACLILTGIHAYLGIHVIERGVIFVDLALAQIAALGSITAFLIGFELHTTGSHLFSLGFTFVGATIFALTRLKQSKITQEAIIGIVYAIATAGAVLVLNKIPSEAEHIKCMLIGNILFVEWSEIIEMTVLYSLIGLFHFIYRKRFLMITLNSDATVTRKINIKWWDFLFYASFGVVVTSSVEIAGVLLVFSYLIVPSVCAMLLSDKLKTRLIIGWLFGVIVSVVGLYLSAIFDLPTGAVIVCTFGLLLILVAISHKFIIKFRNATKQLYP